MSRTRQIERAVRIANAVLPVMVEQFRENIDRASDADGTPFPSPWHDRAVFPTGLQSDRSGGPQLRDSGAMRESLRVGEVEVLGSSVIGFVWGQDYALRQHRGFTESGVVVIPRLADQRRRAREGDFSGIPFGDKVVARGGVDVPPRPFLTVNASRMEAVVRNADRGG